jgi:hypothetical protein
MSMSDEKITAALDAAAARILQESRRAKPERLPPEASGKATIGALHHCLWMIDETKKMLAEGRREKVMQWLGFIQGALWAHGIQTIATSKDDNKPDETSGVQEG